VNGQIYTAHSAKGCLEGFDDLAGEYSDAILRLWRHPAAPHVAEHLRHAAQ
jgi:hypothetical protein